MYSDGDIQAVVLKLNVFMIYSTDEEMAQLISIGGLCEGAVSGYSHLQGGSCGRYFLNAQVLVEGQLPSTSVLRRWCLSGHGQDFFWFSVLLSLNPRVRDPYF